MNEGDHHPVNELSFADRLKAAFPVAFRQDEAFRYALILGVLAIVIAAHGHHGAIITR